MQFDTIDARRSETEPLAERLPNISLNQQLSELVAASGLPPAVALTVFNRGLVPATACSESQWKSFLAAPASLGFKEITAHQLSHAIKQFARVGMH